MMPSTTSHNTPASSAESKVFHAAVERLRGGADLGDETEQIITALTNDELLGLLDGDADFWPGMAEMGKRYNEHPVVMGAVERLGVPGLRFSDGPRGVVMGASTTFPVSMARGATWDVELEERIGRAIGAEMRAQGANFFGGVCINLPRHPAWGRAQETYGEDSYLLGEFGAALVRGIQRHAMAVAKHYALNSMENARFTVDVSADQRTLHEVYLPHFRRVVEEGVAGIMTSYNSINGHWGGENEELLEGILRAEWGFAGVTVSDFIFGLRDVARSLHAGLDVESPFRQQRAQRLPDELANGNASWDDVRRAARRVIGAQLRYASSDLDAEPDASVVFSKEHRALAREAAAAAMVVLRNEPVDGRPVLPIAPEGVGRVAVIGRLADVANTGDKGSSNVHSPEVITPLQGIRSALPHATVVHVDSDDPQEAAEAARSADLAIVVVGYTADDEGEFLGDSMLTNPELFAVFPPMPEGVNPFEAVATDEHDGNLMGTAPGGDRESLRVRPVDSDIIRAVAAANAKTVVSVVTAGAVIIDEWDEDVAAVIISWYAGGEGGHALADVLLGAVDASGRLPYSIPTTEAHLPFFDRDAKEITYDLWHGQRLLDRDGNDAAYPLGYGLSYTTFAIGGIDIVERHAEELTLSVQVTNTGDRPGRHVVQVYGRIDAEDFPRRVLLGFAPVHVAPGATATVAVSASLRPLQRWTPDGFVPAARTADIEASAYSGDPDSVRAPFSF